MSMELNVTKVFFFIFTDIARTIVPKYNVEIYTRERSTTVARTTATTKRIIRISKGKYILLIHSFLVDVIWFI